MMDLLRRRSPPTCAHLPRESAPGARDRRRAPPARRRRRARSPRRSARDPLRVGHRRRRGLRAPADLRARRRSTRLRAAWPRRTGIPLTVIGEIDGGRPASSGAARRARGDGPRAASSTSPRGRLRVEPARDRQRPAQLLSLVALVVCSALLTGAEAAYFSLGRARLKRWPSSRGESGGSPPAARAARTICWSPSWSASPLVNIGASALAAVRRRAALRPALGLSIAIVGMVFVLTTFGEVLPMTLAVEHPRAVPRPWVSRPVAWLSAGTEPGARGARRPHRADLAARGLGAAPSEPEITEEELRTLVDVGAREGVVERDRARDDPQGVRARGHAGARGDGAAPRHVLPRRRARRATRSCDCSARTCTRACRCSRAPIDSDRRGPLHQGSPAPPPAGCRPTSTSAPTCTRRTSCRSPSGPTRCCGSSRPRSSTSPSWWTSTGAPRGWWRSRTCSRSWSARSATSSTRRSA